MQTLITVDHKKFTKKRPNRDYTSIRGSGTRFGCSMDTGHPCKKNKAVPDTMTSLQRFLLPESKPGLNYTFCSLQFTKAYEDMLWNHDTTTQHRSDTNGIAKRVVRGAKNGTSTLSVPSGLDEQWWRSDGMVTCQAFKIDEQMGKLFTNEAMTLHSVVQ